MILALESTCDESSVALLEKGPRVIVEITSSQETIHERWGGVVPELASRAHQESLLPLIVKCFKKCDVTWNDIEAIAVAYKPGLMGPLLVGVTLAKSLAYSLDKPLIGVDHLQGHMASVQLENRSVPDNSLGLLVSGGHSLILEKSKLGWDILGGTRDDAAGEAFDKGARLLGLPYPGGKLLSDLARAGNAQKIPFPVSKMDDLQLSYSGLKSELRRRVDAGILDKETKEDVAAGYQKAIVDTLMRPMRILAKKKRAPALVVSGGVSRNDYLRERSKELCDEFKMTLMLPEPRWCTDNAAMIGAAGLEKWERGEVDDLALDPSPRMNPRNLLEQKTL